VTYHNELFFYTEELLAPCPTPKLEDHPFLAVSDCLFSIFADTLHIWRLYPLRAMVTGTYKTWSKCQKSKKLLFLIAKNVQTSVDFRCIVRVPVKLLMMKILNAYSVLVLIFKIMGTMGPVF